MLFLISKHTPICSLKLGHSWSLNLLWTLFAALSPSICCLGQISEYTHTAHHHPSPPPHDTPTPLMYYREGWCWGMWMFQGERGDSVGCGCIMWRGVLSNKYNGYSIKRQWSDPGTFIFYNIYFLHACFISKYSHNSCDPQHVLVVNKTFFVLQYITSTPLPTDKR